MDGNLRLEISRQFPFEQPGTQSAAFEHGTINGIPFARTTDIRTDLFPRAAKPSTERDLIYCGYDQGHFIVVRGTVEVDTPSPGIPKLVHSDAYAGYVGNYNPDRTRPSLTVMMVPIPAADGNRSLDSLFREMMGGKGRSWTGFAQTAFRNGQNRGDRFRAGLL